MKPCRPAALSIPAQPVQGGLKGLFEPGLSGGPWHPWHPWQWQPWRDGVMAMAVVRAARAARAVQVAQRAHSRPMEVPAARRLRMLQRPKEDLRQATAFSRVSKFLSMPAEPAETTEEHRSDSRKSQELRALLKRCRSPEGLVTMLKNALFEGIRESSIFGAAMQTCGYRCWWMTLQKVRELQLQNAIKFDAVATSIGLTAITWNLRNEGLFDVLEERKEPALTMAKELWQEGVINAVVLTSALKLCTQLECPAAWQWGQQLWQETESGIEKNSIVYSAYITMLERYGDFSEVDRLLDFDEHLSPVLLGALVDLAGHRHDPARADAIWKKMVVQKRVKPIESSYNAYARAYLVSGDPEGGELPAPDGHCQDGGDVCAKGWAIHLDQCQGPCTGSSDPVSFNANGRQQGTAAALSAQFSSDLQWWWAAPVCCAEDSCRGVAKASCWSTGSAAPLLTGIKRPEYAAYAPLA
ncbi:unnamed protein product [Cladocopium goreaui]|uniref:Pentatricopeptide repeat-containing protein, chloroplastic n=1 Tax=Cladocopium goreaui TaxID=2562237 RepID=A0A9P1FUC3_9DINO|nr:unnamed protein product [Cladocopium goreaui]